MLDHSHTATSTLHQKHAPADSKLEACLAAMAPEVPGSQVHAATR